MDQLKVFLKQAVKYRFWIAVGVAFLMPIAAYFVGSGPIVAATKTREGEINGAKTDAAKYQGGGLINAQYQPLAVTKKDALVQDVDATWRKLFATQEPLLKWPPEVQERFRKWGRKYPKDIDRNQVQSTIIDYTVSYPTFVEKIYDVFKPFNFEDGTGIVVAPDWRSLLGAAEFKQDSPPDLSKIWSEQERLWVVTALLDVVARVNDGVGAKTWDDAVIKQILALEVGAARDQDQKSLAKGETLVPADVLSPDGTTAPPAAAPTPGSPMDAGAAGKSSEVQYLKTDSQQFKALPIKMTVLVDQARLANFLVGLENSPMSIEVNEIEFAKPLTTVTKPSVGDQAPAGLAGGSGMGGREDNMGGSMARSMGSMGRPAPGYPGAGGGGMPKGLGSMGGPMGGAATKDAGGVSNRTKNDAQLRKEREKREKEAAAKGKAETKKIDQYYNVVEVTVYGRARFYLAPPPAPEPSTSAASTPPPVAPAAPAEAPKAAPTPAQPPATPDAPKPADAPKAGPAEKKDEPAEAPKPADAPKPDATPKP